MATLSVLAAGCGSGVSGIPHPQPTISPLGTDALGDLTTLDPCELVDGEALPGTAGPEVLLSLDYCVVPVTIGAAHADVEVGGLYQLASESDLAGLDVSRLPRVRVISAPGGVGTCRRQILFEDLTAVEVAVAFTGGVEAGFKPCELATDAIGNVLREVSGPLLGHFSFPDSSLAWLDLCELVPDEWLAGTAGWQRPTSSTSLSGHDCGWSDGAADLPLLYVIFAVRPVPEGPAAPRAAQETITGRRSTVASTLLGTSTACVVETEHIPFPPGGSGSVERLRVELQHRGPEQACAGARAVAELIWPKIPQ